MTIGLDANKAKTARRVVEVLEYFDEQNRQATVMDIARRYDRPQSSTSELLAILVEMGLLYKDSTSRVFRPTPRAAMLGSMFQPRLVRDGTLSMLMDRTEGRKRVSALSSWAWSDWMFRSFGGCPDLGGAASVDMGLG